MWKWLLLLIVVTLTVGPFGHLSQSLQLTPNLLVVFLWGRSWFGDRKSAFAQAIVGGLIIDIVGWGWFGLWTIGMVSIVLVVNALKERLLDESSILHALFALSLVSLIVPLLLSVVLKYFVIKEIVLVVLGNVTLGAIVYYFLAMRLRLFQRWAGRRIG